MKYILDTNIIIYALKSKYENLRDHFFSIPADHIYIPSIVMAELEYGAMNSYDYDKSILPIRAFTNAFEKIDFTQNCAKEYGILRKHLKDAGQPIGGNDMLIAATALAENAVLVTHNTQEFSRIPKLLLEDWTK